jgi:sensor histidine kinase YesM
MDADKDTEFLIYFPAKSQISIFRKGLKNEASAKISIPVTAADIYSFRTGYGKNPAISIQTATTRYLAEYSKNPLYFLSYLIYLSIYLFILGFSFLLRQVSRAQLKRKYENEKKISELQLALIRNQLDPHFTLNAINTIIYSVNYGDRDMAADQLRRFASLYRNLVLSAGSSQRSIEDEIAFCDNYLNLEKMRFGDRFSFAINIANDIDQTMMIPKFLIQIHAENAVKHGLEPLESGGVLTIKIYKEIKDLLIEISDNGIGRKASETNLRTSTGRGLEIMDELYSIHNKIHKNKISSGITDLFDINGKPAGTKVLIRIQEAALA